MTLQAVTLYLPSAFYQKITQRARQIIHVGQGGGHYCDQFVLDWPVPLDAR